jgi:Pleckstrin homology domain
VIESVPAQDLRLKEEGRELVYKGSLKKRGGSQSDSGDLQVFLFDHALLMVKQKTKHEQHKVYRKVSPSLTWYVAMIIITGSHSQYHWSFLLLLHRMTLQSHDHRRRAEKIRLLSVIHLTAIWSRLLALLRS